MALADVHDRAAHPRYMRVLGVHSDVREARQGGEARRSHPLGPSGLLSSLCHLMWCCPISGTDVLFPILMSGYGRVSLCACHALSGTQTKRVGVSASEEVSGTDQAYGNTATLPASAYARPFFWY
eukprot:881449-Rhodomonas_salina.1